MTTPRRKLTLSEQVAILITQAICPDCGEPLGSVDNIQWDHHPALALRKGVEKFRDVKPNDPRFMRARHIECHARKTNGTKATTYGSDKHEIAKTERLENERNGLPKTKAKAKARKYNWPSRKLRSRNTFQDRKERRA